MKKIYQLHFPSHQKSKKNKKKETEINNEISCVCFSEKDK
jgi:hypothetical protein